MKEQDVSASLDPPMNSEPQHDAYILVFLLAELIFLDLRGNEISIWLSQEIIKVILEFSLLQSLTQHFGKSLEEKK